MAWVLLIIAAVFCVTSGGETPEEADQNYAVISVSAKAADNPGTPNIWHILGAFGLTSLKGPVTGKLVHVKTNSEGVHHGCTNYSHDVPGEAWVALIERGSCGFPLKVRLASKDYNASGVIVYDNKPDMPLTVMNATYRDEVYVFVSQSDGRQLAQQVDNGSHVEVTITLAKFSSSTDLHPLVTFPVLGGLMALLGINLAFRQPV